MKIAILVYICILGVIGAGFLWRYFPRGFAGLVCSIVLDILLWFYCETKFIVTSFVIALVFLEIWGTAFLFYWDERLLYPRR